MTRTCNSWPCDDHSCRSRWPGISADVHNRGPDLPAETHLSSPPAARNNQPPHGDASPLSTDASLPSQGGRLSPFSDSLKSIKRCAEHPALWLIANTTTSCMSTVEHRDHPVATLSQNWRPKRRRMYSEQLTKKPCPVRSGQGNVQRNFSKNAFSLLTSTSTLNCARAQMRVDSSRKESLQKQHLLRLTERIRRQTIEIYSAGAIVRKPFNSMIASRHLPIDQHFHFLTQNVVDGQIDI